MADRAFVLGGKCSATNPSTTGISGLRSSLRIADFSSNEKHDIAENMAEIWGLNKIDVSEAMNKDLKEEEVEIISSLDDFDFDDI